MTLQIRLRDVFIAIKQTLVYIICIEIQAKVSEAVK